MIKVEYPINTKELAAAALIFIEKKPLIRLCVLIINIIVVLMMLLMLVAIFYMDFEVQQGVALIIGMLWLFGRRKFNEWLFERRMAKRFKEGSLFTVTFSDNGIIWEGQGITKQSIGWNLLNYACKTSKGYILPVSLTRFLWLPSNGFKNKADWQAFGDLLEFHNVNTKDYPKI